MEMLEAEILKNMTKQFKQLGPGLSHINTWNINTSSHISCFDGAHLNCCDNNALIHHLIVIIAFKCLLYIAVDFEAELKRFKYHCVPKMKQISTF